MKPKQKQTAVVTENEGIVGDNVCTMCLYNIPRSSLMITMPGLVILVCGAAMTAFVDSSQSWTDGLAMLALVFLVLGGVWTLGALIFWFMAWWRLKPKSTAHRARSNVISAGHDNQAVQLDGVISYPCDTSAGVHATVATSTKADLTCDIKTDSEQSDTRKSLPDDDVITVL